MLVMRDELEELLGLAGKLVLGVHFNYVSGDGMFLAHVGWDRLLGLSAEVTDHADGEGRTMVALSGRYDASEDGFDVGGEDMTGESSDPSDPRCAAARFRHLTADMEAVA